MRNFNHTGIEELSFTDSVNITGGDLWGDLGYAAGYVAGTVIRANIAFLDGVSDVLESGGEALHNVYIN